MTWPPSGSHARHGVRRVAEVDQRAITQFGAWLAAERFDAASVEHLRRRILARRRELDTVLASRATLFAISGAAPLSAIFVDPPTFRRA